MARYLLLHGYGGVGPDHWLVWLSTELRARGHMARIRKLPNPNGPVLPTWTATLRERLIALDQAPELGEADRAERGDPSGELVVVAHSLGARTWIDHLVHYEPGLPYADRVALVAPPQLPSGAHAELISGFYDMDLSPIDASVAARSTRAVISSNDSFWPNAGAIPAIVEPLGVPCDQLGDCGHFEPQDGFGTWPGMLAWCLGDAETITR
ncbi:MAG: alpha/beta hydrolase [Solirubrobacteraceae bacterium]|nr:alpha/beta hydrolase [Solirubrobacteraceae bacterium]